MIKNFPTYDEYVSLAKDCLNQSFEMVYEIGEYINSIESEKLFETLEITKDDVWKFNNGKIRTSIVLLHQAVDALLKAKICEVSPLLLIEGDKTKWATLPDSKDKNFNDYYTIGSEQLLHVYCGIKPITKEIISFINELRLKRNDAIHGLSVKDLTPKFTIMGVLKAFTYFLGKSTWWETVHDKLYNDPTFGLDRSKEDFLFKRLDYVEKILGLKEMNKHFTLNINTRSYFCYSCKDSFEIYGGEMDNKWAFLSPNKPDSKNIFCLSCQNHFEVERKNCIDGNCKGNVIYNDRCLTCFSEQIE